MNPENQPINNAEPTSAGQSVDPQSNEQQPTLVQTPGIQPVAMYTSQSSMKTSGKRKKFILTAIIALVILGLGIVAYFFITTILPLEQASSTSDRFFKAELGGDYDTFNLLTGSSQNLTRSSFQEMSDSLKKSIPEQPKQTSHNYMHTGAYERAVVVYSLKADSKTGYAVNLLVKKSGKWQVVNQLFEDTQPKTKVSDYTDQAYSGVTTKAADTSNASKDDERKFDINALHAQAEGYYAQNGHYPTLKEFNDASFRAINMKGLTTQALKDPDGTVELLVSAPTKNSYSYLVTDGKGAVCDNVKVICTKYTMTAILSTGATFTREQLN